MQVWAPPPEGMIQLGWVGPRNGGKGISSGPGNGSQKSEKKTRDSWVTTQAERHCAELVRPCLASNKAHIAQRHPEAPSHPALERNSELTWSQAQSLRPPALLACRPFCVSCKYQKGQSSCTEINEQKFRDLDGSGGCVFADHGMKIL